MDVILNIGLANNPRDVRGSLEVLNFYGLVPVEHQLLDSDTEPTLVAVLDWGTRSMAELVLSLNEVSIELNQDCIALWVPRLQHGALIGPRAAAWGTFNPEFFLMPDGSRLSDSQPAAKAA